jgi:hypothetical protein
MKPQMNKLESDNIDWSLTTWEGARREQLRRWAKLPLENVIAALEEMQEITEWLHPGSTKSDAPRGGDN